MHRHITSGGAVEPTGRHRCATRPTEGRACWSAEGIQVLLDSLAKIALKMLATAFAPTFTATCGCPPATVCTAMQAMARSSASS